MKLLKRPYFAVLLCILVVLGSTALSAGLKLSGKCGGVIDGFYDGVRYNKEDHAAIAHQISELCDVAEDMAVIADNYGINTDSVDQLSSRMRATLNSRSRDISEVSAQYKEFSAALKALESTLHSSGLSERHTTLMQEYSVDMIDAVQAISGSCYNESVRDFLQRNDRFPAAAIAGLFNIQFPAYFS